VQGAGSGIIPDVPHGPLLLWATEVAPTEVIGANEPLMVALHLRF